MYYSNLNRRFFLQGVAAALALPALPSLARADQPAPPKAKRFFAITHDHGFFEDAWFPANYRVGKDYTKPVNETLLANYPGALSTILGSEFTSLKSKLALFRGLDSLKFAPQDGSHDAGFTLAGTGARDSGGPQGKSIDVILSASNHVYPNGLPSFPHLNICMDYTGNSFTVKNGRMVTTPSHTNPKALFDLIFGGLGGGKSETPEQKAARLRNASVVHAVHGDYQSLQNSRRISAGDKQILQEHMELVSSLERRFGANTADASCAALSGAGYRNYTTTVATDYDERYRQLFDVILLAVKCGLTNVVHIGLPTSETSNTTDVENAIYRHLDTPDLKFTSTIHTYSHDWQSSRPQMLKAQAWLASLAGKFMNKLNTLENAATGETYLDNSLVMYVNNLSQGSSHLRYDIPVLLGGGLGGRFRLGRFMDHTTSLMHQTENSSGKYVGVDYTRMLVSILQGFGLTEAEYQQPGMPAGGFGSDNRSSRTHPSLTTARRRDPLPGVLA